jgi:hypothetical protein
VNEDEVVKSTLGIIESIKSDLADHKAKQSGKVLGAAVPKLLARYMKLPDVWRAFAKARFITIRDVSDDTDFDTDNGFATALAVWQTEFEKGKDTEELTQLLDILVSVIMVAEAEQPNFLAEGLAKAEVETTGEKQAAAAAKVSEAKAAKVSEGQATAATAAAAESSWWGFW